MLNPPSPEPFRVWLDPEDEEAEALEWVYINPAAIEFARRPIRPDRCDLTIRFMGGSILILEGHASNLVAEHLEQGILTVND